MTLVVVAAPDNESDLALIACVLEANDISHFVQGNGFGGLFPGPQIDGYNGRRVMVPASCVERAVELLSEHNLVGPVPAPPTPVPARPELRGNFSTSDAMLSIVSFLLLLGAIGMYATTIF